MSLHDGAPSRALSAFRNAPRPGTARRSPVRRLAAAGVVGAAVTATGLVGAVHASAAGSVVVDTCTEQAPSSEFGQPIVAAPEALDAKVKQAALLVFPLQFDRADRARQQFLGTAPVPLGSVTEQDQDFSGPELADALAGRIAELPALDGRGDAVNFHVRNLASVGCIGGAEVPGQPEPRPAPPPEPPAEPPPAQQESASGQPTSRASGSAGSVGGESPAETSSQEPRPAPSATSFTPGPAKRVVPPDYSYVPGSLPPWSKTRFGQAPGQNPAVGDLLAGERKTRQEQVRAAGRAESLPGNPGSRVALPVLVAAIALAGVTSALVRTWVLRRA